MAPSTRASSSAPNTTTPLVHSEVSQTESSSSKAPSMRTRIVSKRHLTDETRHAILAKHRAEPLLSQQQIVEWLDKEHGVAVDRTTIGRTLHKYAQSIGASEQNGAEAESELPPGVQQLEKSLHEWYSQKTKAPENPSPGQGIPVMAMSLTAMKDKVNELYASVQALIPTTFPLDDKWLVAFLRRFQLEITPLPRSAGSEESAAPAPQTWPSELLPYLSPNKEIQDGQTSSSAEDGKDLSSNSIEETVPEEEIGEEEFIVPATAAKLMGGSRQDSGQSVAQPYQYGRGRGVQHLSDEARAALLQKHQQNPEMSQMQLGDWLKVTYGVTVHRATIGRNLKKDKKAKRKLEETEEEVMEEGEIPKTVRVEEDGDPSVSIAAMELDLAEWVKEEEQQSGRRIPDKAVWQRALDLVEIRADLPESFTLTREWKADFKRRFLQPEKAAEELINEPVNFGESSVSSPGMAAALDVNGEPKPPTMVEVHNAVNSIRYFVYCSDYDEDTKKDLLRGLDDIYIQLGEANKRSPTK